MKTQLLTGTDPDRPTLVAIKGRVFDVTKNPAYGTDGQYHGMGPPFYIPYLYSQNKKGEKKNEKISMDSYLSKNFRPII